MSCEVKSRQMWGRSKKVIWRLCLVGLMLSIMVIGIGGKGQGCSWMANQGDINTGSSAKTIDVNCDGKVDTTDPVLAQDERGPDVECLPPAPEPKIDMTPTETGGSSGDSVWYRQVIGDAPGMDEYRWYDQDFGWQHTFDPTGKIIKSAELWISAYDVDFTAPDPERDIVSVDGVVLGPLQGRNEIWRTTKFEIDPKWLEDGKLDVWLDIDSTHNRDYWVVWVGWSVLYVNYRISTIEDAISLVDSLYEQGLITSAGIRDSLLAKLEAAQTSSERGNFTATLGQLTSFSKHTKAQMDKYITQEAGETLLAFTGSLIDYFTLLSSFPVTFDLYLCPNAGIKNEFTIQLPVGVVTTTLTGNLTVRLEAPIIASTVAPVTIMRSSYVGTPIKVNGIDFGTLYFSQDPDNPSVGTLDLKTGEVEMIEKALVTSSYLEALGISPVAIEVSETGVFSPMSLTKGVACLTSKGTIPSIVPLLGGFPFFGSDRVQCQRKPPPTPEVKWEKTGVGASGETIVFKRDRDTFTMTYPAIVKQITLDKEDDQRLKDEGQGYITFFQYKMEGTQITGNLWRYGKAIVIDVVNTTPKKGVYDFIQICTHTIKYTFPPNTGLEPEVYKADWHVNGPTTEPPKPNPDPTHRVVAPNGIGRTGVFLPDFPGFNNPWEAKTPRLTPIVAGTTIEVTWEFNTWLINTKPLEIIGRYDWGFTLEVTVGTDAATTTSKVTPTEPPAKWTTGEPDPETTEGKRYKDELTAEGYPDYIPK